MSKPVNLQSKPSSHHSPLTSSLFHSVQIILQFNHLALRTHQLVRHPLHAADERFVPNRVCDHRLDVDCHGLLEEDEVVLRHAEGVHVARVKLPAGVHGRYLLRLGKNAV